MYAVEASDDLVHWNANHVEPVVIPNPEPPNRVTVRYNIPVGSLGRIFLKLIVTRPYP